MDIPIIEIIDPTVLPKRLDDAGYEPGLVSDYYQIRHGYQVARRAGSLTSYLMYTVSGQGYFRDAQNRLIRALVHRHGDELIRALVGGYGDVRVARLWRTEAHVAGPNEFQILRHRIATLADQPIFGDQAVAAADGPPHVSVHVRGHDLVNVRGDANAFGQALAELVLSV